MRPVLSLALLLLASLPLAAQNIQPASTSNNDSCDISVTPAATLLLPYFEVETAPPQGAGTTTLFTITNTSRYPQIAHVTVWTDWAYPVLVFNVFLTGYDVQGINLHDVIVRGQIAPGTPAGTSINTAPGTERAGDPQAAANVPLNNTANPNFVTSGDHNVSITCANLPGTLPPDLAGTIRTALITGVFHDGNGSCPLQIGFNHGTLAKGYVTIDVVSYCTQQFPTDAGGSYFAGPSAPILFDNVLYGDYQQLGPTSIASGSSAAFDAEGGPMVHIHAVPEGGLSGAGGAVAIATNVPFTFYDRYTPAGARTADRRQPLPSAWASRYIQGGTTGFSTSLKIWREGVTTGLPSCSNPDVAALNSAIALTSIIRFDEHENPFGYTTNTCVDPCIIVHSLPASSRTDTTSVGFPPLLSTDVGGWLYLNLGSGSTYAFAQQCTPVLSAQRAGFGTCGNAALSAGGSRTTTQNWVTTSMFAQVGTNRLSVDFDALALGNGCTPAAAVDTKIGPASQRGGIPCPRNAPASSCAPGAVPPPPNP